MDANKVGALIRQLREEKGLTQRALAKRLYISEQAISKWERGAGCPDISLLRALAAALEIDIHSLLTGELSTSDKDGGNMRRIRFFVCPECGNVITMTGEAQVSCCGRQLTAMEVTEGDAAHAMHIESMDGENYLSFGHPMSKAHYIQFVAMVGYDRVTLVRLYPEQDAALRLPYMAGATYYVCCSEDGLFRSKG